eukprot:snap_masked-scaffold_27-processed-gene-1.34-mRNA-1 protein AED:0.03 eAED:0.04 QI:0/-1/0/1/-1/1/1/0/465
MGEVGCPDDVDNGLIAENFCAFEIELTTAQLSTPRGILSLPQNRILVLERGSQSIQLILLDDTSTIYTAERVTLASASGLNHGLAVDPTNSYIYASSSNEIYRWPYSIIQNTIISFSNSQVEVNDLHREHVVTNVNLGQGSSGHTTRTLVFDSLGRLYVSIGSVENVDSDSSRSRIYRVEMNGTEFPIDIGQSELFADGVRNEVALAFDTNDVLWGAENGADRLFREDLGGDVHEDNPAEELNMFKESGRFYGYPYCWTEYDLPEFGLGRGTSWAWENFMDEFDDDWCRSVDNVVPAALAMQGHSAPLGMAFVPFGEGRNETCTGGFPEDLEGDLIVAFHGSWNREIPTGYKLVVVNFENGIPTGDQPVDLLRSPGASARWDSGLRPVDVKFDGCGRLLVSSGGTNGRGAKIFMIEYWGDGNETFTGVEETTYVEETEVKLEWALLGTFSFFAILAVLLVLINRK